MTRTQPTAEDWDDYDAYLAANAAWDDQMCQMMRDVAHEDVPIIRGERKPTTERRSTDEERA